MRKWLFFLLSLALLLIGNVSLNQKNVQAFGGGGNGENLTQNSEYEKRVGVRVVYDDVVDCFVLEGFCPSSDGGIIFWYINDNGASTYSSSYNTIGKGNKITVYPRNDSNYPKRFTLKSAVFLEHLSDYSLITNVYQEGVKKFSMTEFSSDRGKTPANSCDYSMFQHDTLELCTKEWNSYTYEYMFYSAIPFNQGNIVRIDGNGGTLTGNGKLYKTDKGLYISEFPKITYEKTGHISHFDGWFDAREGGKKYNVGDYLPEGKTLYAQYTFIPGNYPVQYIDVIEDDAVPEDVLNEQTLSKTFDTMVSGEDLGADKTEGAYYEGYYYDHCSFTTVGTSGTKVYRYFKPIKYEIYFDPQDATGVLQYQKDCVYSKSYMLLQNTYRKEYSLYLNLNSPEASSDMKFYSASKKFLGWATEPGGEVVYQDLAYITNLKNVSGTYTLYAVWDENKVTIPVIPKRQGYEFIGWSLSPSSQTGSVELDISENTELYAIWKPVGVKYSTEYYVENEQGEYVLTDSYELDGVAGAEMTIDLMEDKYAGYVVDEGHSKLSGTVTPDNRLVLSVYYKKNCNKISFHANGGEFDALPNTIQTAYDQMVDLPAVKGYRKNYEMDGWCVDANGQGTVYELGAKINMFSQDTVLYAHWAPVNYTVAFQCKEPDCTGQVPSITVARDETFMLPECTFERAGYEFAGWKREGEPEGNLYQAGMSLSKLSEVNQDTVIFSPVFKAISFRINYDANEAGSLSGKISGYVMPTNYTYNQASPVSKDSFTVNGYHLKEWNTKADGTGTGYAPGEDIQGKYTRKQSITLYAIWEKDQQTTFTVTVKHEKGVLDTLQLTGNTGETLEDVLKRNYQESLSGEEAKYFYKGYEVTNTESLEKTLGSHGNTQITLEVVPRSCLVRFIVFENEEQKILKEEKYEYQDKIVLSGTLGEIADIASYSDGQKTTYRIGDIITLNKNIDLYPQHKVRYKVSEEEKEVEELVVHGKRFVISEPVKAGYVFSGWIDEKGENYGNSTVTIPRVIKNLFLCAKWSIPLDYTIKYDIDNEKLCILDENVVTGYSYGTTVDLPVLSQLAVKEGYTFIGWYLSGDIEQNIITRISADMHEDIVLKAKIVKTSEMDDEKEEQNLDKEQQKPGDDANNKNPVDSEGGKQDDNKPVADADKEDDNKPVTDADKKDDNKPVADVNQQDATQKPSNQTNQKNDNSENPLPNGVGSETVNNHYQTKKLSKGKTFTINHSVYRVIRISGNKGEVSFVKYNGKAKKVKIGTAFTYQGVVYTIRKIEAKAFYKNKYVTSVVLGNSVTDIGNQAFASMKKLSKVTISKNLTKIGKKAFYKSKALKKIVISSKKVKSIGKKAIAATKGKVKVYVPKNKKKAYKKLLGNKKLTVIAK